MINIKTFLFFCCLAVVLRTSILASDGNKMAFQAYSGGMMLHCGYVFGGTVKADAFSEKIKVEGVPFGLGGLLRFHFGEHLRIGGEGYSTTLRYGKNKSYATLGWGGLLIDCKWEINKFTVFLGGTIGGGSLKNVIITNDRIDNPKEKDAIYRKYSVMIFDPFLGVEYAVSQKIRLIAKVDYIFNIGKKQSDFATGTRFYAGIIFLHASKNK